MKAGLIYSQLERNHTYPLMGSLPVYKMRASTPPACHLVRSGRNPDERIYTGGLPVSEKERSPNTMSASSPANGYPLDPAVGSSDCRITRTEPSDYSHQPVMLSEVLSILDQIPSGYFLDATLGGAGHSKALLELRDDLHLVGIDQDQEAHIAARKALMNLNGRFDLVHERFDRIDEVLDGLNVDTISGALFDLGVSSYQLDTPARGFSFRTEGPLDMRMNSATGISAKDLVNNASYRDLSRILKQYGDERHSRRIARAIIEARPLATTSQLAEVVIDAMPAASRRSPGHPARRTFQAIRIAVNNEIEILESALNKTISRLKPDGRCVIISYHSGEDRVVKRTLRTAAGLKNTVPKHLPMPEEGGSVRLLDRGGKTPSENELMQNPRATSARLRWIEKVRN